MQDFMFKQIENGTFSVIGYLGDEAEVTVPATHEGQPVTVLFDKLFQGHEEITKVNIPDSVTDIGGFVFDGLTNLKHVDLPKDLLYLWQYAFVRSGIEEITLPEHLRQIPSFCFQDCTNLTTINCNKELKKVYAWAFQGCTALETVNWQKGTEVSPQAFATKELNT